MRYERQASLVEAARALAMEMRLAERWDRSLGARFAENIAAFNSDPAVIKQALGRRKTYLTYPAVALPEDRPQTALRPMLEVRRSQAPSAAPVPLRTISALLRDAFGVTQTVRTHVADVVVHKRSYPSPGALYPCEVYLLANEVEGLDRGVYHFDATRGSLSALRTALPEDELCAPFYGLSEAFPCAVAVTGVLSRVIEKYALRAYRFMLLEAGHMGQNACLAAASLDLACNPWGAFYDAELNGLLGVDGRDEAAIHVLLVGRRDAA
jgi:SagB-type dehydrogenase family enzyme